MKHFYFILLAGVFIFLRNPALAQLPDTTLTKLQQLPAGYISSANAKMTQMNGQITSYTTKVLQRQQQLESGINTRLTKLDSVASHNLFTNSVAQYQAFQTKIQAKASTIITGIPGGSYFPYLDTLKSSLNFLSKYSAYLTRVKNAQQQLQSSLTNLNQLESKLQAAENIEQYLQQRQTQLKGVLSKYGNLFTGQMGSISRNEYFYAAQVKEFKTTLQDPSKAEAQALNILRTTKVFNNFMKKNSFLAGLLNLPNSTGFSDTAGISGTPLGLQPRSQVMSKIQSYTGKSGTNASSLIQQSTQAAQGQLDQIRSELNALISPSGVMNIPNFTPNNQKTKTFFKRIVLGTNLQTTSANNYFPTTTDIGISVGYKLNNKNQIGIGASYNIGWGNNFNQIKMSSQGVGLRSYIDLQLIKTIFVSGGFEYNYQQPFTSLHEIYYSDGWQQVGLIGISKITSIKTQFFTATKIQLLWDFLSYYQVPRTQPFLLRVGYNF